VVAQDPPGGLRAGARRVLEDAWQPEEGYCVPNARIYPHQWLWDSCFHSIAWAALGDPRAVVELRSMFARQFRNGFVPHMNYRGETIDRGPRRDVSGFTQPPVYALALDAIRSAGLGVDRDLLASTRHGLGYLLRHRMREGLCSVVHPWETGCDDSPRWDAWVGASDWVQDTWLAVDLRLVEAARFSPQGDATGSAEFACAPSLFNGILSHALLVAGRLLEDERLRAASHELGEAMDELLWDEAQGMFVDRPLVGGGDSARIPTIDGALSALGSVRRDHALACLEQLQAPSRFAAPHGLRYLPLDHPIYRPDQYWRGSAWPQLTYLAVQACRRWGLDDLAATIGAQASRAIPAAGWSEHWNPETGEGLGARPHTWSALAAALDPQASTAVS
jgi:hypothetical protein